MEKKYILKIKDDCKDIVIDFTRGPLEFGKDTGTKQFFVKINNNKKIVETNMRDPIFFDYISFNDKLIELVGATAVLVNKNNDFIEDFKKKEDDEKKYKLMFEYKEKEKEKF